MTPIQTECPEQRILRQFLLGQLSIAEIEDCQFHLSQCDPCVETVENLKVGDTFSNIASEALKHEVELRSNQDESLISQMIQKAEAWAVGTNSLAEAVKVSQDKAAEVQRLVREPLESDDLGAIEHYRLIQLIGTGSSGIVYLAMDTKLDRHVVLKVLRPSLGEPARKRFVAEAKATAAIDHPNVVTIYEVGNDGPLSYITMQWTPGQTLEQKLESSESLSVEETRKLVEEIAHGLTAAHEKDLIHRDIKPANIWIPDNDEPAKILDFGLVRVNDEDPQLTCTGMIAGTPCFMSPEQSRGDKLDARSDLFSLGCLMYQSLTGQLPFRSDNALATLRSIQQDQPTDASELDPSIDTATSQLVMALLAKSPHRRPASASAFVRALNTDPSQWEFEIATPSLVPQSKSTGTRSSRWVPVAATLVAIAMATLGFTYHEQIVRIAMNEGEIKIETKVDDVKIEIVGEGNYVKVVDLATEQSIEIRAGSYEIRALGNGNSISIDKNELRLSRGETEIVKITRLNHSVDEPHEMEAFRISNVDAGQLYNELMVLINQYETELSPQIAVSSSQNQIVVSADRDTLNVIARLVDKLDQPASIQPTDDDKFDRTKPYPLARGDVLGVFIEGVIGGVGQTPPLNKPAANTGLPPTIGFPISVEHDGFITLPFVDRIEADGQSLQQLRQSIVDAYKSGSDPILQEQSKIIVTLYRLRNPAVPYFLDSGDVLGLFIDGVLGEFDEQPPIHNPNPNTGLLPSLGYPVSVEFDGHITLPYVDRIDVRNMTISEVRDSIKKAFLDSDPPILNEKARIMVNLIRPRSVPQTASTKALNQNPFTANRHIGNEDLERRILDLELESNEILSRFHASHPEAQAALNQLQLLKDFRDATALTVNTQTNSLDRLRSQVQLISTKVAAGEIDQSELYAAKKQLYTAINNAPDISGDEKYAAINNFINAIEERLNSINANSDSETKIDRSARIELLVERRNAIRKQTFWERELGMPITQPVYDGMTYDELLQVAITERDLTKINPAIVGLSNLSSELERDETIKTIMNIARRGTGVAAKADKAEFSANLQMFLATLPTPILVDVFLDEISNGTTFSKSQFLGTEPLLANTPFCKLLNLRTNVPSEQSKAAAAKIAKSFAENMNERQQTSQAFEFLSVTFGPNWNALGLDKNEDIQTVFSRYIDHFAAEPVNSTWMGRMLELSPDTPQLTESVESVVNEINEYLVPRTASTRSYKDEMYIRLSLVNHAQYLDLMRKMDILIRGNKVPVLKFAEGKFLVESRSNARVFRPSFNAMQKIDLAEFENLKATIQMDRDQRRLVVVADPLVIHKVEVMLNDLEKAMAAGVALQRNFLLVLDEQMRTDLASQGKLVAAVNDRIIDRITFVASEDKQDSPVMIRSAVPIESGKITFRLDEQMLAVMKLNGLRYEIPRADIGKISKVEVVYDTDVKKANRKGN